MIGKDEIIRELKNSMEFYGELGFKYLPVKSAGIANLLNKALLTAKHENAVQDNIVGRESGIDRESKEGRLRSLREEIGDCQRCKLSKKRNNIVFGEGNPDADILFVGEGPGRDEDIQARPFVGDAGKLLTNMIIKLGLKREGVYIANIVKCRPPMNRNPEADEITVCKPFVEKQISIIQPKIIVCLGTVSAHALLGVKIPISKMRGSFFSYKDIPVMPTFHPAYLLRNSKDKWLTWNDMQKVLEKLS